jgi:hypothetical protein
MIHRHGERVRLEDVAERDVLAYLESLQKASMAAASQTRHLAAVRGLFRHLKDRELVEIDPTELIERPRPAKPLPSYLSIEEVDALVAQLLVARVVDHATGSLMELRFVKVESTFDYFASTVAYLKRHGKPHLAVPDNARAHSPARRFIKSADYKVSQVIRKRVEEIAA